MLQDYDTPEMIKKCLSCTFRKCTNCLELTPRFRANRNKYGEYDYSQYERLYKKGYSDFEIADILSCHRHTVYRWRTRLGLPRNTGL